MTLALLDTELRTLHRCNIELWLQGDGRYDKAHFGPVMSIDKMRGKRCGSKSSFVGRSLSITHYTYSVPFHKLFLVVQVFHANAI